MGFSTSFVAGIYEQSKVKKNLFLEEMDTVMPRHVFLEVIFPFYNKSSDKSKGGRPKMDLLLMIKTYCLQQRYNLGDPTVEKAIYDRISFQKFLDIDVMTDRVPDETTILNFRRFLEDNDLQDALFDSINEFLDEKGLIIKDATLMDATIIRASSSTKNKDKKRDPEMKSTFKGKNAYFGMKTHVGTDKNAMVHTVTCTGANEHDSTEYNKLMHGEEKSVYADSAYYSGKRFFEALNKGIFFGVCLKGTRGKPLTEKEKIQNSVLSSTRCIVEHVFGVIKNLWGHRRTRYKGLKKNHKQRIMLCGLQNLYRVRKKLAF